MTRETLDKLRSMGIDLDDGYDFLADTLERNRAESENKTLLIKYISSSIDDKNIYLMFEITTPILKTTKAVIFVQEVSATNETAINNSVTLLSNQKQRVKVSFLKTKKFDRYFWQDGFVYQATLTCDGFSTQTDEFSLRFEQDKNELVKKTCYCDRDFSVEEMERIVNEIRDNTFYEIDGIRYPISNLRKKLFNRNNEPSQKYITELVDETDQTFKKLTDVLNNNFKKYNINKCIQKIHFLTQMYTETEYFTKTIEGTNNDLDYDPYRGRGFMHLTSKLNYNAFKVDTAIDILDPNYNKVSTDLNISARTATWFWSVRGKVEFNNEKNKEKYKDILGLTVNELSLFEDKYIDRICKVINGGDNAIEERKANYLTFKNIFDYEKCINKK